MRPMTSAASKKILVLGIDGLDAKLTSKYIREGAMPNMQSFLRRGAAETNYEMIGGHPTITPPMWTTLATGANPAVHGITDYFACGSDLGEEVYNFDSRRCKAEPLWNVSAEAGYKTLVWHWPGSSWPPTSDNPNLHVVDGTQPGGPNVGTAEIEGERMVVASVKTPEVLYKKKAATDSDIPCFISGMEVDDNDNQSSYDVVHSSAQRTIALPGFVKPSLSETPMDIVYSPIKDAKGWANAPAEAKEFTVLYSNGLVRRPCLITKDDKGVYNTVLLYESKKAMKPLVKLPKGEFVKDVVDEAIKNETHYKVNRNMRVLDIAEDGSIVRMWMSAAMDFTNDAVWSPKTLLNEIVGHVGYPQPVSMAGGHDERLIAECTRANWEAALEFNAAAINYLIQENGYEMIFSHFHNVDLQGHLLVANLKNGNLKLPAERVQALFKEVYKQADRYVGKFMHLLDEGWTILIVSDHGQVCPEHGINTLVMTAQAVNAQLFYDWGYTALVKDETGAFTGEIDWSRTSAVMQRISHIYINLKGRDATGIVDPKDKYELEERIITDLYSLKDQKTGHRLIQLALRNKDAVLLGNGGPEAGDIIYFVAEGYTADHGDSLSTCEGACDTTCRSVFMAAGQGIRENYLTSRCVRHVDIAPTVAVLAGLRMPEQCEGAPVYQILV